MSSLSPPTSDRLAIWPTGIGGNAAEQGIRKESRRAYAITLRLRYEELYKDHSIRPHRVPTVSRHFERNLLLNRPSACLARTEAHSSEEGGLSRIEIRDAERVKGVSEVTTAVISRPASSLPLLPRQNIATTVPETSMARVGSTPPLVGWAPD